MRKIFAIGGIPGTGKTTLMNAIMKNIADDWVAEKPADLLDSIYSKSRDTYVFGKYSPYYDAEGYAQGTDKLSMAVQPKAIEFIKETKSNILFEGDRLFTASLLEVCVELTDVETTIIILSADDIEKRYAERGSEQSEKFIQGRKTKYDNIAKNFFLWDNIVEMKHNTPEDTQAIISLIHKEQDHEV